MDKHNASLVCALIGHVPKEFSKRLTSMKSMKIMSEPQLDDIPVECFLKLRALVIGTGVDAHSLSSLLPSLRTANPTLCVVGLCDSVESKWLVNWADVVFNSPDEAYEFLAGLFANTRTSALAQLSIRAGRRLAVQAMILAGLLSLWWVLVAVFAPPPFLLPSPVLVLSAFIGQWDRMIMHLLTTAKEAGLGFLVGNALGITLAILLHRFLRLQKLAMPVLISFQAIPIIALAPLLGVWLGTGLISKVAMAAIICFFPMVINSLQAFASVEHEYVELFSLFHASYIMKFKRLLFPASASGIIAALKISAGLSVVGAIVAEMTGSDRGLGYLILNGAYRLETDIMFVAMLLSGLLGISFFHMPDILRSAMPKSWTGGLVD